MIYFLDDFKETLIRPSEGWNVEVPRSRLESRAGGEALFMSRYFFGYGSH